MKNKKFTQLTQNKQPNPFLIAEISAFRKISCPLSDSNPIALSAAQLAKFRLWDMLLRCCSQFSLAEA
jgi:hypothetical protein